LHVLYGNKLLFSLNLKSILNQELFMQQKLNLVEKPPIAVKDLLPTRYQVAQAIGILGGIAALGLYTIKTLDTWGNRCEQAFSDSRKSGQDYVHPIHAGLILKFLAKAAGITTISAVGG